MFCSFSPYILGTLNQINLPVYGRIFQRRIKPCKHNENEQFTKFQSNYWFLTWFTRSFNMDMHTDHTEEEYLIACIKGGREYILKEKNEDLPKARFHQKMWVSLFLIYTYSFSANIAKYIRGQLDILVTPWKKISFLKALSRHLF